MNSMSLRDNTTLINLWSNYIKSNKYAKDVKYNECIAAIECVVINFLAHIYKK